MQSNVDWIERCTTEDRYNGDEKVVYVKENGKYFKKEKRKKSGVESPRSLKLIRARHTQLRVGFRRPTRKPQPPTSNLRTRLTSWFHTKTATPLWKVFECRLELAAWRLELRNSEQWGQKIELLWRTTVACSWCRVKNVSQFSVFCFSSLFGNPMTHVGLAFFIINATVRKCGVVTRRCYHVLVVG